jgi:dihydrofolate reductase
MDWLPPFDDERLWEEAHAEMWKNLEKVDTFVLGRRTYQIWENFWPTVAKNPNATDSDSRFSRFADETKKIVLSTTLTEAKWKNSRLISSNAKEELLRLKEQPGKDIAVAGGAGAARSIIGMGMVDDLMITVHPVILGKGKPLFDGIDTRQKLKLVRTKDMGSGAILLHYRQSAP